MIVNSIEQCLHSLLPSEKLYLDRVANKTAKWVPQSVPQWLAFFSRADELFYGGAAGGGKTDMLIGMGVECHHRSVIFRRVYPNLKAVIMRSREIIGDNGSENKSEKTWTFPDGGTLEFGAVQYEENKTDWQGRPHDLKGFDELPEFTESQYVFICGWNRTTDPGQRSRIITTGNPPIDEAGSWIVRRWAAWLDDKHPNPAKPGELRWYATIDGEEVEYTTGKEFNYNGELIQPRSRTFIPAKLEDNIYLTRDSNYRAVLQSLPEPLRSMMLNGDFKASSIPDPWQIIPTEWVLAAQRRWNETEKPKIKITAVGVDPARGGRDCMSISTRYDNYFDSINALPGSSISDGPAGALFIKSVVGDDNPMTINIDIGGIGSSVYDSTVSMYNQTKPINSASASEYRDKSGKMKMRNIRAEMYWQMRDALDPINGMDICLPPGNEIVADLCSARYKLTTAGVLVEEKEEIKKRIGRSPDKGESILLANYIPQTRTVKITPAKVGNYLENRNRDGNKRPSF